MGRPVWTHEFGLNLEGLREEAKISMMRLKNGIEISDEYVANKTRKSIDMLEEYCKVLLKLEIPKKT